MIQEGDVRQIGQHKISCGCISTNLFDTLIAGEKINVLYSDPPWGDGNLKYWATMNKKQTGAEFEALSYDNLIARLDQIIKHVDGYVFIETGLRWEEKLMDHFADIGLFNIESIPLEYNSPAIINPCIFGGTAPQYKFDHKMVHLRDAPAIREIISVVAKEGDIVADPCCGMGYTAQAAIDNKCQFRGNEFNAKRLMKTIARLEKDAS
jgi:hypothetical protein